MTRQHAELGYAVLGVLIWPTRRRLWLSAYIYGLSLSQLWQTDDTFGLLTV